MELQNTQNSLNDPEQRKKINLEVSKYLIFKAYLKTTVIKSAGTQVSGTEINQHTHNCLISDKNVQNILRKRTILNNCHWED